MSNMEDSVGTLPEEDFLKFISAEGDSFLSYTIFQLGQFVENGFLKKLFDKNSQQPVDKAQLLVDIFGDMGDSESECPSAEDEFGSMYILPDVEMTSVDQPITPETSWKKDKQKARITADKQVIYQSFTANPDAQTPVKKPLLLGAKTSAPGVTHILTGYKETDDEQEQVRDIIVYDIPYTWDVEKVLGELTLWGKTIKLSLKRQHKYQTLRVKIVLNSFTLPQFNKFWTTDLGEEMTMATLWVDRKPTAFLTTCGASAFKIIQTSKGKRKLVGYFENWETTLTALGTPQAKNVPDKKSGKSGQRSGNVNLKKQDSQSSTSAKKQANSTKDLLKDPKSQKSKSNKKF
ncbi:unnamed protein product [Rhizophagus irregularis]|nr:unnamed protein product [Rhizophagus irregularis]